MAIHEIAIGKRRYSIQFTAHWICSPIRADTSRYTHTHTHTEEWNEYVAKEINLRSMESPSVALVVVKSLFVHSLLWTRSFGHLQVYLFLEFPIHMCDVCVCVYSDVSKVNVFTYSTCCIVRLPVRCSAFVVFEYSTKRFSLYYIGVLYMNEKSKENPTKVDDVRCCMSGG